MTPQRTGPRALMDVPVPSDASCDTQGAMRRAQWISAAVAAVVTAMTVVGSGCQSTCREAVDCGPAEYCGTADNACLGSSGLSLCVARPTSCTGVSRPVCGCDNKRYDNACAAAAAGVAVALVGECPVKPCNADTPCEQGSFCLYAAGACLGPNATGTCTAMPTTCPEVSFEVCGCDATTYANSCVAQQAGVSVAVSGSCTQAQRGGSLVDGGSGDARSGG